MMFVGEVSRGIGSVEVGSGSSSDEMDGRTVRVDVGCGGAGRLAVESKERESAAECCRSMEMSVARMKEEIEAAKSSGDSDDDAKPPMSSILDEPPRSDASNSRPVFCIWNSVFVDRSNQLRSSIREIQVLSVRLTVTL